MTFEYFFFAPLKYEYFIKGFENRFLKDDDRLLKIYLSWVSDFCRKAHYFYQYQYRLHSSGTWSEFCRHYKIPEFESPDNLGLDTAWNDWKSVYGLDLHYESYQLAIQDLNNLQEVSKNNDRVLQIDLDVSLISKKEINRIWFGGIVVNSPRVIEELRNYPYEKYLQTSHWKRIRAVLLLINNAVCQARDCNLMGESWYGGFESEIDVHHITYKDLGNEKFDDLVLLCRNHHKIVHENLENTGTLGIELVYM